MAYATEIVNMAVGMVRNDHHSAREAARLLHVGRAAIGRWVKRVKEGMPTHQSTASGQVHNRTGEDVLQRIKDAPGRFLPALGCLQKLAGCNALPITSGKN